MTDTTLPRHPDCRCPRAVHRHGSRTTYVVHQCRCDACREANNTAARHRHRQKAYGRYNRYVDAEPVRAHLRALMDQGMGWKRVALTAGLYPSTVSQILYGKLPGRPDHPEHRPPRRRVFRHVGEAILNVHLDLAPGALVDPTGTMRRIQALVARGWSMSQLANRLGIIRSNFALHTGEGMVSAATHQAVVALYEELWNQDPPEDSWREKIAASRARNHAAARGWAPPMAWDDDLIDDPEARPDTGSRERGRLSVDDVHHFMAWCDTSEQLAHELGVNRHTLHAFLRRNNMELPTRIRVGDEDMHATRVGRRAA